MVLFTRMNAHTRTYRYIGDAAANMSACDIIIKRGERYMIGMHHAQNGDWYLIEESQPQFPMFRTWEDLSIRVPSGVKKVLKHGKLHYYALSTLYKNYSDALNHISKLQHDVMELQCVVWLDRRWRLFPVCKVDPPPTYIQNDMTALAEWFARDTTSLICIQPRLKSSSQPVKKATWLNLGTWAYADVRRLILSHLSLGDMILVEAAHGMYDKISSDLEEHICTHGYADLAVWYVNTLKYIPHDYRLMSLLTYRPVTPALIKLEGFASLLRHAVANNQRDFIVDVSHHAPLYNYVTYSSFAHIACRNEHYDLMFELLSPQESCDDIWDWLARSSDDARDRALAACVRLHAIIPMKWHQRNPFIRACGGYQPMIDWAMSLFDTQS